MLQHHRGLASARGAYPDGRPDRCEIPLHLNVGSEEARHPGCERRIGRAAAIRSGKTVVVCGYDRLDGRLLTRGARRGSLLEAAGHQAEAEAGQKDADRRLGHWLSGVGVAQDRRRAARGPFQI